MGAPQPDSSVQVLTQDILRDVEVIAKRSPKDQFPGAFKRLRARAHLTMSQVGNRFHRKSTAVFNWENDKNRPPQDFMPALLELFGIPNAVYSQFLVEEIDSQLLPQNYARGDSVLIEFNWWTLRRGRALQSLYNRALDGSDQAMKLLFERGDKIEDLHAARLSAPTSVGDSKTALAWTRQALIQPVQQPVQITETTTCSDPLPENGAPADKSNGISD